MHSNYIQLPPDSTGKKVGAAVLWILPVANASVFFEGNHIVGGTSGTTMHVVQRNTTANYLYCKVHSELQDAGTFTVGENLLVDNVIKSIVSSSQYPIYHNFNSIVSHDNPFHGLRVDAQGQAYVRYEEGAQILDAVGRSKTVEDSPSGLYKFTTLDCWDTYMQTTIVGTASKTLDSNTFALKLQTGTATNDAISLMSHKYHIHVSGTGLYNDLLLSLGDIGKTNLAREWGYADNVNGIFFDLMGTELNIVVRNVNNNPVDTHYTQAEWNRDKLDGTGISGVTLDVTKVNRYWFDFHRGVRFRAGIYGPDGTRIVAHDVKVANTSSALHLPTTSLPVRVWQGNTGTVISTSEMTFYESSVKTEGCINMHKHFYEAGGIAQNVTSAAWVPLISLRPQTDSKHTIAMLLDAMITSVLTSDANIDGRVKVCVFKNPTLTGATFAVTKADSRYNIDTAATSMGTDGKAIVEFYIKGTNNKDIENHFTYLDEYLVQNIDGTKNVYTLAAKAFGADCTVIGGINWNEYFVR